MGEAVALTFIACDPFKQINILQPLTTGSGFTVDRSYETMKLKTDFSYLVYPVFNKKKNPLYLELLGFFFTFLTGLSCN